MLNDFVKCLDEKLNYVVEEGISTEIRIWLRDIENVLDFSIKLEGTTYVVTINTQKKDEVSIERVFYEFVHIMEYRFMTFYCREKTPEYINFRMISATENSLLLKFSTEESSK
ncbi:hypothetical protein ACYSNR_14845 [Enterococcus sp. LJL128]